MMEQADAFAWLSLLQRRADYARKAASGARTPDLAHEFEELAAVYLEAMEAKHTPPAEAKDEIIRHLQLRANQFLTEARGLTTKSDAKRADDLKYLAGVFGAEASRLKNDATR
jgi:hypothetical protein